MIGVISIPLRGNATPRLAYSLFNYPTKKEALMVIELILKNYVDLTNLFKFIERKRFLFKCYIYNNIKYIYEIF